MHSIRSLSIITGVTYLSMIPFGILGILYVPNSLLVMDDMGATIHMIQSHMQMFHLSIFASIVVQLIQILLVLMLYKLLNHASKTAGILMIAFILPAVSIAILNEANYLSISSLLSGSAYTTHFTPEYMQGLVGLLLEKHKAGVMIAQIFWGIWLFPMGYLAYRSGYIPRIIGVLLMIGCFGYLMDSLLYILNFPIGITISEYTFIGEVLLPIWLIAKAKTIQKMHPLSE